MIAQPRHSPRSTIPRDRLVAGEPRDDPAGSSRIAQPHSLGDPAGSFCPVDGGDPAGSFPVDHAPLPHLPSRRPSEHPAPILRRRVRERLLDIPLESRHHFERLRVRLLVFRQPPLQPLPIRRELASLPQNPSRLGPEPELALGTHFDQELPIVVLRVVPAAKEDQVLDLVLAASRVPDEVMGIEPAPPPAARHPTSPPISRGDRPPRDFTYRALRPAHRHRPVLRLSLEPDRAVAKEPLDDRRLEGRRTTLRIDPGFAVLADVHDHLVPLGGLDLLGLPAQPVGTQVHQRFSRRELRSRLTPDLVERKRDQLHLFRREIHQHPSRVRIERRHEEPPAWRLARPSPCDHPLEILGGQLLGLRHPFPLRIGRCDPNEIPHLGIRQSPSLELPIDEFELPQRPCHPDPLPGGNSAHPTNELQVVSEGRTPVLDVTLAGFHPPDEHHQPVHAPVGERRLGEELAMKGRGRSQLRRGGFTCNNEMGRCRRGGAGLGKTSDGIAGRVIGDDWTGGLGHGCNSLCASNQRGSCGRLRKYYTFGWLRARAFSATAKKASGRSHPAPGRPVPRSRGIVPVSLGRDRQAREPGPGTREFRSRRRRARLAGVITESDRRAS